MNPLNFLTHNVFSWLLQLSQCVMTHNMANYLQVEEDSSVKGKVSCRHCSTLYGPPYIIRAPLESGHCLRSQLDRVVYKTTPEIGTTH